MKSIPMLILAAGDLPKRKHEKILYSTWRLNGNKHPCGMMDETDPLARWSHVRNFFQTHRCKKGQGFDVPLSRVETNIGEFANLPTEDTRLYVQELGAMRHARNGEGSRRLPSFFQADDKDTADTYNWPIDQVVEWSHTAHGGRQFQLFAAKPRDAGCMRWGLCDTGSAPAPENDTEGG